MDADSLTKILSAAAGLGLPAAIGWAWRTESRFTTLATLTEERKDAEDGWKQDLKDRLDRIERKLDERRP